MVNNKNKKVDKREYTLMVVPHQGQSILSVRLPMKILKAAAVIVGICAITFFGTLVNYRLEASAIGEERSELEHLRNTNGVQAKQIEKLAQETAIIQENMDRLNALDADIRRMVNKEESSASSRSGLTRSTVATGGQGGPGIKPSVQDVAVAIQELQEAVKVREQSLKELKQAIANRDAQLAVTPSIWPCTGDVTSRFGWRSSPWGLGSDWHPGIDIADSYGTPIRATAEGVVVFSGWYSGYGLMVKIDHGNGIETVYAHSSNTNVHVGEKVKKGQTIASMGSSGNSTGNHLHYEVRVNGTAVNPATFL